MYGAAESSVAVPWETASAGGALRPSASRARQRARDMGRARDGVEGGPFPSRRRAARRPSRSEDPRELVGEGFDRQLLADVEHEALARVLDRVDAAAHAVRVAPGGVGAQ